PVRPLGRERARFSRTLSSSGKHAHDPRGFPRVLHSRSRRNTFMTWLVERDRDPRPAGARFADLVARPRILRVPGAHNPLAALLARKAGFEAIYLSGAA